MSHTAHPKHHRELREMNLRYMALKRKEHKQKRCFQFDPGLSEAITWLRNDILEKQSSIQKEVNHAT
jgi:hypothetical protein